ncbi:acyl-CoA-binding domain-containing protein 3 [Ananas comosus]|uniref:Acyl-CoA-binding domain-containing protein 3 n=1 Tax=Ananas comosus TaxID=4615 RepID=A0A6P5GZ02_ANACO|nr:acyl-CoA-binding domain-containing protein 3 [Ananas comosus]
MDFYQEFLLTVIFCILLALLLGKISSSGGGGGDRPEAAALAADLGLGRIGEEEEEVVVVDHPRGTPMVAAADRGEAAEVEDLGERAEEKGPEIAVGEGSEPRRSCEERGFEIPAEEKGVGADGSGLDGTSPDQTNEEVEIERSDSGFAKQQDHTEKLGLMGEEEGVGESLLHWEDEWEGIERSELEDLFQVAVKYAESEVGSEKVSKLSGDSQMKLYGLYKVATEGPCYEPQPMALKLSARTKWNAWQSLGNMNPEVAMEQYVTLLSGNIPEWAGAGEKPREEAKDSDGNDSLGLKVSGSETPDTSSALHQHPDSAVERLLDDSSRANVDDAATGPKLSNLGLTRNFLFNLLSPARVTFLTFYR